MQGKKVHRTKGRRRENLGRGKERQEEVPAISVGTKRKRSPENCLRIALQVVSGGGGGGRGRHLRVKPVVGGRVFTMPGERKKFKWISP